MSEIKFDERQVKAIGKASVICTIITTLYLLLSITVKYLETKDILYCTSEILLLIIIGIVFTLCIRKEKEMNLPKTVSGKSLPTDKSFKSLMKRAKAYFFDSLLFSVMYMIVIFTFEGTNNITSLLTEGAGLFLISFIMDFIIGERKCRKFKKMEDSLDEE